MRRGASVLAALFIAGCAAPEPFDLRGLELSDRSLAPPSPPEIASAAAEVLKKEELTLEDVLVIADVMNPELDSERRNVDLATAAIWEAKLYPNPSARLDVEEYRTDEAFGDSKRVAGIGFPLVVSGRIGAATSAAEKEREVAAVHFVWRRREILSEVKRAFVEVLGTRRNVDLARETRDIAKTLHDVTNERFKAQAIPEMELLKAAVNLAKAEIDLRLVEKNAAVAIKTLHVMMGNADFPKDRFAGDLAARFVIPSFEALRGHVTSVHPLLEEATKGKEAAELNLETARAERFPDLDLEVLAGRDGAGDSIVEGGISIPLPFFNRNQGKIMHAEVRIRQSELQLQSVRNDLVLRLTDAYRSFVAAQDRVAVYRDEILPKAQKALDQTHDGYKLGKFGYLDLLDAQRTLAEARFAFVAALSDLNLAAIELEKLTGTGLESIR